MVVFLAFLCWSILEQLDAVCSRKYSQMDPNGKEHLVNSKVACNKLTSSCCFYSAHLWLTHQLCPEQGVFPQCGCCVPGNDVEHLGLRRRSAPSPVRGQAVGSSLVYRISKNLSIEWSIWRKMHKILIESDIQNTSINYSICASSQFVS